MDVQVKEHGDVVVIKLIGRLDSIASTKLDFQLQSLVSQYKKIVLNFEDLAYISSAGIRLLLLISKKLDAVSGQLAICCVQQDVLEVIRLTGFDQVFKIYNSEIESISHF